MSRYTFAFLLFASPIHAADFLPDRTIGSQPTYKTKPGYLLLCVGDDPTAKVWLVRDGDDLYVDRNGNGDLTEVGEKVGPEPKHGDLDRLFEIGAVTCGGRTHKGFILGIDPLEAYATGGRAKLPFVKAALAKDPKALCVTVIASVQHSSLKGGGIDGRIQCRSGPFDLRGVLQFGDNPQSAPVVWMGGPLEVTFDMELPVLRLDRTTDVTLVVGTQGIGPGTFAAIHYGETIPSSVYPILKLASPTKDLFELKRRC